MFFITILEKNESDFQNAFKRALSYQDACIELRMDALPMELWSTIALYVKGNEKRLLGTYRSEEEGGFGVNLPEKRIEFLLMIDRWGWGWIDLEASRDLKWRSFIQTPILFSSHTKNRCFPTIHKWAFYPEKLEDLLDGIARCRGLCYTPLGEAYQGWRLLSYLLGGSFLFCALNQQKAIFGQPLIDDLLLLYRIDHFRKKGSDTPSQIYALLGSPVQMSLSHQIHNRWFLEDQRNAIYLKLEVKKGEIGSFLDWARQYPFAGFSVTMPHKEDVCAFLSQVNYPVKSVNTLLRCRDGWMGYNTDGIAAIELLLDRIPHLKKLAIFGAGGSAQAIAHEAVSRGIDVILWGRNPKRVMEAALKIKARACIDIEDVIKERWDAIVQATPCGMKEEDPLPFDLRVFDGKSLIFDLISVPEKTLLLKKAEELGLPILTGKAMLLRQAELQRDLFKRQMME